MFNPENKILTNSCPRPYTTIYLQMFLYYLVLDFYIYIVLYFVQHNEDFLIKNLIIIF